MKKLVISLLRRPDRKVSYQKNELSDFQYIEAVDGKQELFRNINAREDWLDHSRKDLCNKTRSLVSYHTSRHGKNVLS